MPLQNRVTPEGDIVAVAARGLLMGNRGGCLHHNDRTLGRRRSVTRRWIACLLAFRGRRRTVMAPRRYTELFFLDEATALAAGHRPCFECRRSAARSLARHWPRPTDSPADWSAEMIDRQLHAERLDEAGTKRTWVAKLGAVPPAAMVKLAGDGVIYLVTPNGLRVWSWDGYGPIVSVELDRDVIVLTPPSLASALRSGYRPLLHPSADISLCSNSCPPNAD